jgi:nucleoside-diphosphate-sugar epimerase
MNRVIVSGANGFIGRFALPLLVEAGFEVHALSRAGEPAAVNGVSWHNIDLMDFRAVDALLKKLRATHLLHMAWYTEHGKFWNAAENLQWVGCSLNLLNCFAGYGGKRVAIAGSCAEYDWSEGHCSEISTDCKPATLYGTSKHALHEIAEMFCAQEKISLAWGRVFFLYGPDEVSSRFVPTVINGLLRQETVPCSDGKQIRDFMYVEDVSSAFVALLSSELTGAINIASGEANSLREIGAEIKRQLDGQGELEFGALQGRKDDPEVLTADVRRLNDMLDWCPHFTLKTGIARSIDWWKTKATLIEQS